MGDTFGVLFQIQMTTQITFESLKAARDAHEKQNHLFWNAHFSRFRLMLHSLHFWTHNLSCRKWLSMSLYIIKSSKNIFIKLSKYYLNALVTAFWYVGGSF